MGYMNIVWCKHVLWQAGMFSVGKDFTLLSLRPFAPQALGFYGGFYLALVSIPTLVVSFNAAVVHRRYNWQKSENEHELLLHSPDMYSKTNDGAGRKFERCAKLVMCIFV